MPKLGRGCSLKSQSQQIVVNVVKYLERENPHNVIPRAARATGVSKSSISKILANQDLVEAGTMAALVTPGKRRPKVQTKVNVDNFDIGMLRRIVYTYHQREKQLPTLRRLQEEFSAALGYNCSKNTTWRLMQKMGFKWRKMRDNRALLVERNNIRTLRAEYLRRLRAYKAEGRPINYTDETYINATHTKKEAWSDASNEGARKPIGQGQQLIVVHAGNENGFVENALCMFRSGQRSGDYHDAMNFENYEKWLKTQLLPNIPDRSVIIIDNASYHSVHADPAPTSASRKDAMQAWLRDKGIHFEPDMLKPELYELVKLHKPRFIKFKTDEILASPEFREKDLVFLRLPPYHPELNAIEKIWAIVKEHVARHNITFTLPQAERLAREKFASITAEEWRVCCERTDRVVEEYMRADNLFEDIIERVVINLQDDSDDDTASEPESQSENEDDPAPMDEMEGVAPLPDEEM